ncbi:MAG: LCP family protein [Candidatus Moranbacteria bacterium]|nr:LCP family protein [Candidatus Moranbacteria bacterium]
MYRPEFRTVAIASVAIAICFGGLVGWKIFRTAEKISIGDNGIRNLADMLPDGKRDSLKGEKDGRINVLLLGRAGTHYPGQNLTDTIMLASIDLSSRRSAFFSIPRDLFVNIPDTNLSTKINSLYQQGISQGIGADAVVRAVEDITGQDIPYYVILDFDGFEKIIDEIGGVTVNSERDILDTRYPGKNYSYETFQLSSGWHTLDGATALKYARERHDDPEGDFGRAKRQQQIIKAFQEKVFSAATLLNVVTINRILDTLGESIKTNLTVAEMMSFTQVAKTIDLRNASTVVVDAWKPQSLLRVSHINVGGVQAFILLPRTGNWNEVRDLAGNVFEQDTITKRREAIGKEAPSILIVSRPADVSVAKRLQRALGDIIPGGKTDTMTITGMPDREKSGIVGQGATRKFQSLDELLRLFPLEQLSSVPGTDGNAERIKNADFVIVLGKNMDRELLSEDATTGGVPQDAQETDPFPEFFPPQAR